MVTRTISLSTPALPLATSGTGDPSLLSRELAGIMMYGLVVHAEYSDGHYTAEDSEFHIYGVGQSPQDAFEDWGAAFRGRFEVLLQDEGSLAPYLARELDLLKARLQGSPHRAAA